MMNLASGGGSHLAVKGAGLRVAITEMSKRSLESEGADLSSKRPAFEGKSRNLLALIDLIEI